MTAPSSLLAPWSWPRLLVLVFGPGLALALVVLIAAPVFAGHGLPRVWAVLGGVLLVVVPAQLLLVRRFRPPGPVLQRGTVRGRRAVLVGTATALVCVVLPAAGLPLERVVPGWADVGLGSLAGASPAVQWTTIALWLVAAVLVGPVVEEAWFRGCVQPRISGAS